MEASQHTLAAIATLQAHYGQRFLFRAESHLMVWEKILGERDPAAVAAAVDAVCVHHTHGAPGLAEVRQALDGRWEPKRFPRTDAHGSIDPRLGSVELTCLVEYGSGRVIRAANANGDLVEPETQRVLTPADSVPAALLPPSAASAPLELGAGQ